MKRKLTYLTLLLTLATFANAQFIRHADFKTVGLHVDYQPHGLNVKPTFNYSLNGSFRLLGALGYHLHKTEHTLVQGGSLSVGPALKVYSNGKNLYFDLFTTSTPGYQWTENQILGKANAFYFEQALGLQVEYYFNHWLSMGAYGSESIYFNSLSNRYSFNLGLFLSYNF